MYVDKYIYFWSGGEKQKEAKSGGAVAITRKLETNIIIWIPINKITLHFNCASTTDSDVTIKKHFFDKLSEERDKTIIKKLCCCYGNKIIGRHGEDDVVNDGGTELIKLYDRHTLKILNNFPNINI